MARTKLTPKKERKERQVLQVKKDRKEMAEKGRRPPLQYITHHPSTTVDFIRPEGIAEKTTPYMGNGKLTEHAQNLKGCEKCNLRKAVGNL